MRRELHMSDKDPVHHALRQIVSQLLKGMGVKTTTARSVGQDGVEVEESHRLPVFYIAAFSSRYPDLPAVTSYIAPFLGADEKIPESQRRVLAGHVAAQGFEMLGTNYSAIRLIVDGEPESIIFKDHTQG
jgi:hypothetical protein